MCVADGYAGSRDRMKRTISSIDHARVLRTIVSRYGSEEHDGADDIKTVSGYGSGGDMAIHREV